MVGVAFDVPVVVVDESVVVVTQAGEVGHGGVTAVGGVDDVVDLVDALPAVGEPAVGVSADDCFADVGGDRANRGEGRDDLPVTVDDQRRDDSITGQALGTGGSDGGMRHSESFQHPHRMVL